MYLSTRHGPNPWHHCVCVISYISHLLLVFMCHVNPEHCSTHSVAILQQEFHVLFRQDNFCPSDTCATKHGLNKIFNKFSGQHDWQTGSILHMYRMWWSKTCLIWLAHLQLLLYCINRCKRYEIYSVLIWHLYTLDILLIFEPVHLYMWSFTVMHLYYLDV